MRCSRIIVLVRLSLSYSFGIGQMTDKEAINLAEQTAVELNLPWSRERVEAVRRRFWPFPAFWRVVATVSSQGAVVTMRVHERRRTAEPLHVRYPEGAA